jgi:uncharacterized DUF497 family protein
MRFEWDEDKNMINNKKHGVWFEEGKEVFADRQFKTLFDNRHSSFNEDRYLAIGFSKSERILMVSHAYQDSGSVRLISARVATKNEREFYNGRRIRLV